MEILDDARRCLILRRMVEGRKPPDGHTGAGSAKGLVAGELQDGHGVHGYGLILSCRGSIIPRRERDVNRPDVLSEIRVAITSGIRGHVIGYIIVESPEPK